MKKEESLKLVRLFFDEESLQTEDISVDTYGTFVLVTYKTTRNKKSLALTAPNLPIDLLALLPEKLILDILTVILVSFRQFGSNNA